MKLESRSTHSFSRKLKRISIAISCFLFVFIATVSFSKIAHAGLSSLLMTVFGSERASAGIKEQHAALGSQTIQILTAHTAINPTVDNFEVIPVSGGEMLSADIAGANATSTDAESQVISIYTVRSGDTLTSVAKMFNVSVNTIVWANNISRSTPLQAGQSLVILPVSGISYTIKKGDTLAAIAKKYQADSNEIVRFNDLSVSSSLTPGDVIIIPDAEITTPVAPVSSGSRGRLKVAPNEPCDSTCWNWPMLPGYFMRPIAGGVKSQNLHGHNAIDIAAPVGTPIKAAAAGTVIISRTGGWNGGYGNFVVIAHPNGTQTLYAHMLRTAVSSGQSVSQGATIGYIGMTGLTTGPHLHLEIRGAANPF